VVVVVGPTEAESVLPGFLKLSGPVAALPVVALDLEDDPGRDIRSYLSDEVARQFEGALQTGEGVVKTSRACFPALTGRQVVAA
jgi:hypothetical protein